MGSRAAVEQRTAHTSLFWHRTPLPQMTSRERETFPLAPLYNLLVEVHVSTAGPYLCLHRLFSPRAQGSHISCLLQAGGQLACGAGRVGWGAAHPGSPQAGQAGKGLSEIHRALEEMGASGLRGLLGSGVHMIISERGLELSKKPTEQTQLRSVTGNNAPFIKAFSFKNQ